MSSRISTVIRGVLVAALLSVPATVANAADLIAPGPYVAAQPDSFCAREGYIRSIERRFGQGIDLDYGWTAFGHVRAARGAA
mgnify:CR=1 FL=1